MFGQICLPTLGVPTRASCVGVSVGRYLRFMVDDGIIHAPKTDGRQEAAVVGEVLYPHPCRIPTPGETWLPRRHYVFSLAARSLQFSSLVTLSRVCSALRYTRHLEADVGHFVPPRDPWQTIGHFCQKVSHRPLLKVALGVAIQPCIHARSPGRCRIVGPLTARNPTLFDSRRTNAPVPITACHDVT
ncbi:hypothetical protein ACUXPM_004469 [Ralstonia sp. 151470066-2]|jgi:hypothetical protein